MSTVPPFIKSIRINKVRHLEDFSIEIDEARPRTLILTGPNGCGKTSLLWALKEYLEGIPNKELMNLRNLSNGIDQYKSLIDSAQKKGSSWVPGW